MTINTAIVPTSGRQRINDLKQMLATVKEIRTSVLIEKVDFGTIPGTSKPTLYKPGAEKIMRTLRLRPHFETLAETIDFERGFIMYRYRCQLLEVDTGLEIAESIGSCNSFEDKYRWRWVPQHEIPAGVQPAAERTTSIEEFKFAYDKRETSGKYGKPESYWQQFDDAINDGTVQHTQAKTSRGSSAVYRIESKLYQIPNPRVFDVMNTLDKMAQKRAFVSAVLMAGNVSEYFTVDLEDLPDFGGALDTPIEITNPSEIDDLREKFLKSDDVEDAEVITEKEIAKSPSKIESFDDIVKDKKDPKDRRLGANTVTDPPTSKTWAAAEDNRRSFLNYGVSLGLGEGQLDVWNYIQSRYYPGRTMQKFSEIDEPSLESAKARLDQLATELKAEVGAPKQRQVARTKFEWNEANTALLKDYLSATFDKSIIAFDALNVDGAPIQAGNNLQQAINDCCDIAIIKEIPFLTSEIEYIQQGNRKEMIFHLPKVNTYRHAMTDDTGRPMPFRLFGGRTAMKKMLSDAMYRKLGIEAWEPGKTYTLDTPLQFMPEIAFNKDAEQYMKVSNVIADDIEEAELEPEMAGEIPF